MTQVPSKCRPEWGGRSLHTIMFVVAWSLGFAAVGAAIFGQSPSGSQGIESPADDLTPPTVIPLLSAPLVPPQMPLKQGALPAAEPEFVPTPPASGFDPRMLRVGESAFNQQCTQCHEAAKSLEKAKSFPEWVNTVRRMAEKPDASIPKDIIEPIAAYLTSQNAPAGPLPTAALGAVVPGLTFNGTVSPTWRGGNQELQNGGFFPDLWLGANWNNGLPISARATTCISCHNDGGGGSTFELVDAVVRLDAMQALGWQHPRIKASTEFGRFIVPFGAFAAQSNPGVYRTVTRPLMYNMGMRVRDMDLGDPVLPMPYSDEGASLNLGLPVTSFMNFGFDGYVVNGLQGTSDGIDFDMSRSYTAINSTPSLGGRATLGNDYFKLGASAIGGSFSSPGGAGPNVDHLGYRIYGLDAAFRYRDLFRLQAEYARRDSDHMRGNPGSLLNAPDIVDGCYAEAEMLLTDYLHTSFLFRYDWQRQGAKIPDGSGILFNGFNVQRLTYGLNFTLYGGSLLMFNYEYWLLPAGFQNLNVFGVRWAATF